MANGTNIMNRLVYIIQNNNLNEELLKLAKSEIDWSI